MRLVFKLLKSRFRVLFILLLKCDFCEALAITSGNLNNFWLCVKLGIVKIQRGAEIEGFLMIWVWKDKR